MKLIIVNLRKWIVLNFKTLFIVFAIGLLITGSLTQRDKYLVITKMHQRNIILETNINNATRDLILNDWHQVYKNLLLFGKNDTPDKKKITGLDTVIQENNADYIFILFYVGFLLLYISRIKRCKTFNIKLNWLFIILTIFTIVGGFLDYIENLGTDKIVHIYMSGQYNQLPDAGIVGYPSRIKWSLLAIVVFVIAWQTIVLNLAILWLSKIIDFLIRH